MICKQNNLQIILLPGGVGGGGHFGLCKEPVFGTGFSTLKRKKCIWVIHKFKK